MRTGAEPPPASLALTQTQLQLPLSQAQPLLGLLAFPADLPADFCVNSVGNTFFCRFCQGFKCPGEVIPYDFRFRRKCEIIRRKKVTFCDKFFAQTL